MISLVKIRLFWVVESSKYSFWRFWCLFCDWTGGEIGKCLGRGYSSCRQKKEKWMREKSSSAHADLDALNTPLLTFWKETRWWLTHPWINWLIIKYYEYSNLRFCIFTITSTILHQSEIHEPIYILINLISLLRFFENFDSFGPKFRISQIGNYTQKQRSNIFGRKTGPVLTYLT